MTFCRYHAGIPDLICGVARHNHHLGFGCVDLHIPVVGPFQDFVDLVLHELAITSSHVTVFPPQGGIIRKQTRCCGRVEVDIDIVNENEKEDG